jgi:hypothetical protein
MWSLEPPAVILASDSFEWREPLLAGWLTATERFHDEAWARALWQNESHARIEPWWSAPTVAHVFTAVASAEHVDAELRRAIGAERDVLRGSHPALAAILEWPHEWSDALARLVARRLKEYAGDPKPLAAEFGVPALMDRCAHATPVTAIDAFLDGWPEHVDTWPTWARAVDSLMSVLRFRRDLHVSFNE